MGCRRLHSCFVHHIECLAVDEAMGCGEVWPQVRHKCGQHSYIRFVSSAKAGLCVCVSEPVECLRASVSATSVTFSFALNSLLAASFLPLSLAVFFTLPLPSSTRLQSTLPGVGKVREVTFEVAFLLVKSSSSKDAHTRNAAGKDNCTVKLPFLRMTLLKCQFGRYYFTWC